MWDLAEDPRSIALIEALFNSGKPVAAVCHAPGVLHHVQFQGRPLVQGKRVTGFTNAEEEAVHLTKVVPFLVEDELKRESAFPSPNRSMASALCRQVVSRSLANEPGERVSASRGNSSEADA